MQRGAKENIMKGLDSKETADLELRAEPSPDPFLRVFQGGEFVRSFQLKPGIAVAGRDPRVDIPLPGPAVSRRHFQIEYAGENRIYVQDLESQNGTRLNGDRVVRARIEHGDRIALGDFELLFFHPHPVAEPKVIPFPKQETNPGLDIGTFPRKTVQRAASVSIRIDWTVFKSLGLGLIATSVAAVLAWQAYQWKSGRDPVAEPPSPPTAAPQVKEAEPASPVLAPAQLRTAVPVRVSAVPSPLPTARQAGKDLARSLRQSLRGVDEQDLRAADRLVASAPSPTDAITGKEVSPVKGGDRKSVSVEITLPKLEGKRRAGAESKSTHARAFDATKYREMLTSKVGSVESCYVAHAPSVGEQGTISVWFTIAGTGKIRKSGIERSTIRNKPLMDCIVNQMLATNVDPPPWDGFTVTYTFRFGSRSVKF
jgi:hypothetical protein